MATGDRHDGNLWYFLYTGEFGAGALWCLPLCCSIFFAKASTMKKPLLKVLICPACRPAEVALTPEIRQECGGDILQGDLICPACGHAYPIRDGLAYLEPPATSPKQAGTGYESPRALASYLWSHYGDLLGDSEASDAYHRWAGLMAPGQGLALDIGSAVGRFAFEIHDRFDFVIGIDKSESFIRTARELLIRRGRTVLLPEEGQLVRETTLRLPAAWHGHNVEFLVADAQALPFRSSTFSCLASLNLVDKLPCPLRHLAEMDRVALSTGAQVLVSDPFSWSLETAEERHWLGGKTSQPFAGRGLDNIEALLRGELPGLRKSWSKENRGHVWWKIRTHANHFELIRSCYIKARR